MENLNLVHVWYQCGCVRVGALASVGWGREPRRFRSDPRQQQTVSVLYLAHLFTITRTVGIRIELHDRSTSTVRVKVWRITEKSTHNLENTSLFRCCYTS